MRKNITNHKHTALAVAMATVLALTGCGSMAATEVQTVEITESEVTVPETETETVTLEVNNVKADLEVKTLTEIASEPSPKAETIGYTYTDMNAIMYAKSAVNVRSLPSTDGTRLGSLVANQPVAVTGQCNETGWYRIQYGDGEAYVSNKYLVGEEQTVVQTEQNTIEQSPQTEETPVYSGDTQMIMLTAAMEQFGMNVLVYGDGNIGNIIDSNTRQLLGTVDANGQVTVSAGSNTPYDSIVAGYPSFDETISGKPISEDAAIAAAIAQFGPNIIIFDDGAIHDPTTWKQVARIFSNGQIISTDFNRSAAEEVWAYVNKERVAAGLNEVAWDEEIYNFACQRAQAIITNFSHEGCGNYSENIQFSHSVSGYEIHTCWYKSHGHHVNYMNSHHTRGACAVYVYNGTIYAVEEFL